jgi:hypothetical protein
VEAAANPILHLPGESARLVVWIEVQRNCTERRQEREDGISQTGSYVLERGPEEQG